MKAARLTLIACWTSSVVFTIHHTRMRTGDLNFVTWTAILSQRLALMGRSARSAGEGAQKRWPKFFIAYWCWSRHRLTLRCLRITLSLPSRQQTCKDGKNQFEIMERSADVTEDIAETKRWKTKTVWQQIEYQVIIKQQMFEKNNRLADKDSKLLMTRTWSGQYRYFIKGFKLPIVKKVLSEHAHDELCAEYWMRTRKLKPIWISYTKASSFLGIRKKCSRNLSLIKKEVIILSSILHKWLTKSDEGYCEPEGWSY